MSSIFTDNPDPLLAQLLRRSDIWRGDLQGFAPQLAISTGHSELNKSLLNDGWPTRSLIEVCQKGFHQQEWLLFSPVLKNPQGYIVLLNPPMMPFCQGFIKSGINLDRIIVVQTTNKADFLASFVELARTESCATLLAWQQNQSFTYTDLRKCLLAANEGAGLCVLFRPESAQQQASPAILRLISEITASYLQIKIFKQKGVLQQDLSSLIKLSIPTIWRGLPHYHLLDQSIESGKFDGASTQRKSATILSLRRGKR